MPNTWDDPNAGQPQYRPKQATNASEQVLGLYQKNFGRSASSAEADHWVNWAGGGSYLAPDALGRIDQQFQKEPEYAAYQGARPGVAAGQYIPGVTLGTSLADDAALRQPTTGGGLVQTGAAEQETTNAGMQSAIRDQLLKMMGTPTPTAQDPSIAPAISAFNAAQNKAAARQVTQNAEAFGAAGLESSGARLGADRGVIEQQGLNEGTFAANAVLQQLEAQQRQVAQGLQLAMAGTDQDLQRRLQKRLADLNATIQREGLRNQVVLGAGDLELRKTLGLGNLQLGKDSLRQQGQQFNDSMGLDIAKLEAGMNNQALINLLYGG